MLKIKFYFVDKNYCSRLSNTPSKIKSLLIQNHTRFFQKTRLKNIL